MEEYLLGIDIGSTTVKFTIIDNANNIVYNSYERHYSQVKKAVLEQIQKIKNQYENILFHVSITGSAGMGLASKTNIGFVQEVQASYLAVKKYYPQTDAVIELGGEDAKIIFISGGLEQRMNGTCAGGTGAFIDQMAALLNIDISIL